ncbi:outer membrane protein assembly factor BamB family protein [Symbiobacterium terraclitae]|uniref:outer membrane protein assembly factor BamB family protein n=1 Tax=Symbiobacterium terraclitae TaxID=557451 RepID=UPI0035B503B7
MVFYFVQQGETLFAIARRYKTTVHALVTANRLKDPNAISPGQALLIPRPGEKPLPQPGIVHRVRKGETVIGLAARFGTTVPAILMANQIAHPEFVVPGQRLVIPEPPEPGPEWPVLGRTPARTGSAPDSLGDSVRPGWSYRGADDAGVRPSPPVTRYGRVYVGLGDGCYHAVDQETGAAVWRTAAVRRGELPPGAALPAPAVHDGLIYLCGPGGGVRALEARSGRTVWQGAVGEGASGTPLAADGILYCGSADGALTALEAKTGAQVWRRQLDGPVSQPAALGDGRLFAVTDAGSLWAVDALTGQVAWRQDCGALQPPVFADLVVVAGGCAFDPLTGEVLWTRPDPGCSPAVRGETLWYPGLPVDLFTGREQAPPGSAGEGRPAASADAHLLAGGQHVWATADPGLVCWDCAAGALRWSVPLPAPAIGIALSGGRLFLTLADNSLIALETHAA